MSHLIAIAVGPVQEFIAAARRTRDLWFGSYLLSEISRSVARSVEENGGMLIFPASSDANNVANVILAVLPIGEPRDVADQAKRAAEDCWKSFAKNARHIAGNAIIDEIWIDQLNDVIEFYAAWVESSGNYSEDHKKLMRLLAGRKNCRDFQSQQYDDSGIPKSSLDGQRPSVFRQPHFRSQRDELRANWPNLLRLAKGEELDIIGVTKRVGKKHGETHPSYSSVARIAAETWLRGKCKHPKFADFRTACGDVPGLNRVAEQTFDYFPYEGTIVFKDRHSDLVNELGPRSKLKLDVVAKLLKELGGEPSPYLAILVADGDRMGAAISELDSPDERRLVHWRKHPHANRGWSCPEEVREALRDTTKVRMILATPAIFKDGWKPDLELGPLKDCGLTLVGASVGRWKAVSGWSLAPPRGPKPIRRMVPAGSVYFFEVEQGAAESLAERWLEPVSDDEQEQRDGFGLAIWGTW